MIRLAAIEAVHRGGTRRASFEAATCSESLLRSAQKATGVRVAGLGLAFSIDPGRKTQVNKVCRGVGIAELAVGGSAGSAAVADK
jgi:hypothetical protein